MPENKLNFDVNFVVELFKDVIELFLKTFGKKHHIWTTYVKSIQVCAFKYGSNLKLRRGAGTWHLQENTLRADTWAPHVIDKSILGVMFASILAQC